jgi:hypothetical protein
MTLRNRPRSRDIICPSIDLSARHQFHYGKAQKKADRWIDRDLFSGIECNLFKRSCRRSREEQIDATAGWRKILERGSSLMSTTFSDDELARIERDHPQGLSSDEIVGFFTRRGLKFTEATLRKYVQLGLLPRSRRVALKGKQRGSHGLYPAAVVRRIQRLKAMLTTHSIEEIQREYLFVRADVEELERTLERIFLALSNAAKHAKTGDTSPRVVTRELSDARALAANLVAKVTSVETRLTMQARLQREAV